MIIYHEYLIGTVNEVLSVLIILRSKVMSLYFVDVYFRHPGISIRTGDQYVFGVYIERFKVNLFKVLHTPGCVAGLPLLLVRT